LVRDSFDDVRFLMILIRNKPEKTQSIKLLLVELCH